MTMSCLIDQCIKIYWYFLSRRENLNSSGVCLTTLKNCRNLIRIVTSGKNGSLTESFIASREEENAIDPKLGMKKIDKKARF